MKKFALFFVAFLLFVAIAFCACSVLNSFEPLASAEEVQLPDDGVVGDNLFYNSEFEHSLGLFSNSAASDQWYVTNTSSIARVSDYHVVTTTGTYAGLNYLCDPSISTFTISLRAYCTDSSLQIGVRGYTSSWVAVDTQSFSSSEDWQVNSFTFTIDPSLYSRLLIVVWRRTAGSFNIDWAKMEQGTEFTGYVPNYSEIEENERDIIYNQFNGWTSFVEFRDYKSDDSFISDLSSSNGGLITYTSGVGTKLSSSAAGTSFKISFPSFSLSTENYIGTFSLGYSGNFAKGSVVLSFDYSYYTGREGVYPFNGIDPVDVTYSYSLDPGVVFVYTLDQVRQTPTRITLTIASGTDFYLTAYMFESGSFFTHFPQGGSQISQAAFDNGYNSGYVVGKENGYSIGFDAGYGNGYLEGNSNGLEEGYNNGFTEALSTYENGTWWDMLSALINVPITFIMSLISFEIFGFNFANVFRTIILLTLFFFLLRKLL